MRYMCFGLVLNLANAVFAGEPSLLVQAKSCDDYSKPGYDRDHAVQLYLQYVEKEAPSDAEKIFGLHRVAQLYSYNCRPGQSDYPKAILHYQRFLDLAGDRLREECVLARSNLASLDTDPESRFRSMLAVYGWATEMLSDPRKTAVKMLYSHKATAEQQIKERRGLFGALIVAQDAALRELRMIATSSSDERFKQTLQEMGIEVGGKDVGSKTRTWYIESVTGDGRERKDAAVQPVERRSPEPRPSDVREETPEYKEWVRRRDEYRRKCAAWIEAHPEEYKIIEPFMNKQDALPAEEHQKLRRWLEENQPRWQDAPFAKEVQDALVKRPGK